MAYNLLKVFSLCLVSAAIQAAVIDDCPGENCNNKMINVLSADYFNIPAVNISGSSQVTIDKKGNINKNRQNFQQSSKLIVNTSGGITGSANVWVMKGASATFNVTNAMQGGSYTANGAGNGGVLNLNATHAISAGKLLLDNDAVLNINAADAISGLSGNNLRFKGKAVINLNHEKALLHTSIKLEGDSRINVNVNHALDFTDNINFAKTYDTKQGSVLELNGHSVSIGSISGNDTSAKIINSGKQNAFIYSGLTHYGVPAGHSYNYTDLLKTGVLRSDAVISTTPGDITRQAVLSMRPDFSDRAVLRSDSDGVWLTGLYSQQKRQGKGITHPEWQGYYSGIQLGVDIWPGNEDASHKTGFWLGWLYGKSTIIANSVYRNNDTIGSYNFTLYGAGVYHRYTATQGWYINSVLQYNRSSGDAQQSGIAYKAKIKGQSILFATEMGYPMSVNESFILLPVLGVDYQSLTLHDYQFAGMRVHNNMDNLLQASAGARLYYELISYSGIQWSPFLEVKFTTQLAARDKTRVHIIDSGYQQTLLTTYAGSQAKLAGGITVRMNDYFHYYAKIELDKQLKYQSENQWAGSAGVSFSW